MNIMPVFLNVKNGWRRIYQIYLPISIPATVSFVLFVIVVELIGVNFQKQQKKVVTKMNKRKVLDKKEVEKHY